MVIIETNKLVRRSLVRVFAKLQNDGTIDDIFAVPSLEKGVGEIHRRRDEIVLVTVPHRYVGGRFAYDVLRGKDCSYAGPVFVISGNYELIKKSSEYAETNVHLFPKPFDQEELLRQARISIKDYVKSTSS